MYCLVQAADLKQKIHGVPFFPNSYVYFTRQNYSWEQLLRVLAAEITIMQYFLKNVFLYMLAPSVHEWWIKNLLVVCLKLTYRLSASFFISHRSNSEQCTSEKRKRNKTPIFPKKSNFWLVHQMRNNTPWTHSAQPISRNDTITVSSYYLLQYCHHGNAYCWNFFSSIMIAFSLDLVQCASSALRVRFSR